MIKTSFKDLKKAINKQQILHHQDKGFADSSKETVQCHPFPLVVGQEKASKDVCDRCHGLRAWYVEDGAHSMEAENE